MFRILRLGWGLCRLTCDHSWSLPDDVFERGEIKPTRPLKKKSADGANGLKKRKAANEVCCDTGLTSMDGHQRKKPGIIVQRDKKSSTLTDH